MIGTGLAAPGLVPRLSVVYAGELKTGLTSTGLGAGDVIKTELFICSAIFRCLVMRAELFIQFTCIAILLYVDRYLAGYCCLTFLAVEYLNVLGQHL